MAKTTVNLRESVRLRLENLAAREGTTLSDLVNELLDDALRRRSGGFASHAAGEADVDDLGVNAEKYLREHLG
ncbi:MAG: hypothetical protein ACRDUY_07455 [Nitriliruptorales bacterium]